MFLNRFPLVIATTRATRKVTTARSAKGSTRFPGRTAAIRIVNGMTIRDVVMTSGFPTTTAASRPMRNFLPLNFSWVNFLAASEIGMSPSMKREVIFGINTITAAMFTPSAMISATEYLARTPIMQPSTRPMMVGSPKNPRYFLASLISKSILLIPGILSRSQLRGAAIMMEERADMVGRDTPGMPK